MFTAELVVWENIILTAEMVGDISLYTISNSGSSGTKG